MLAGRRDVSIRGWRRVVVGARHHPRDHDPDLRFAVVNIGSHPDAYGAPRFKMPENAVALTPRLLPGVGTRGLDGRARAEAVRADPPHPCTRRRPHDRVESDAGCSSVASTWRRMSTADVIDQLASGDLTIGELLHGRASFALFSKLAEQLAPDAPFARSPSGTCARCTCRCCACWRRRRSTRPSRYHAVAAPVMPACWRRSGPAHRSAADGEHGIYSRERDMELARAEWIEDRRPGAVDEAAHTWAPQVSPLRPGCGRVYPHVVAPGVRAGVAHRHAE